jgi:hypothetical protein
MLYSFVEHFYLTRFQYLKYITTFADLGHQVVEHGLGHLPFTEKQVATPTGNHLSLYSLLAVFYFDVHHIILSFMGNNICTL